MLEFITEDEILSSPMFWISFIVSVGMSIAMISYWVNSGKMQLKAVRGLYFMTVFMGIGLAYFFTKRKQDNA